MTTYLFPGQGAQHKGMGKELLDQYPEYVKKADEILGYSVRELILEDKNDELNNTNYTQPALFIINALTYLKKRDSGLEAPSYLVGHSLGEYNALFAANVFDFETGLRLVQNRGALMSHATGGGMAAVIGLKSDAIQQILDANHLTTLSIANYNSFMQNVISGPKQAIESAKEIFTKSGAKRYVILKVSGAFHSTYMNPVQNDFSHYVDQLKFNKPTVPVIANLTGHIYEGDIKQNLINQITHPVLWIKSIEFLTAVGESHFEELGPGSILTDLVDNIMHGR